MNNRISKLFNFKPVAAAMGMCTLLALSAPASATLIGDTFDWEVSAAGFGVQDFGTDLIGAGVDATSNLLGLPIATIDFGASTLDLTVDLTGLVVDPGGTLGTSLTWIFSGLDWVGQPGSITDVILAPAGTNNAVTNIGFTADSISITTGDFTVPPTIATYSFDIVAVHTPPGPGPGPGPAPGIPEPASVLLMGLGLASLRFVSRRGKA